MTGIFLNASMEARKGAMKMKLVRAFIAFVIVSLFVGISSAFNGQNFVDNQKEESTNYVEKVENDNLNEVESTEIVDKEILEQLVDEEKDSNNSFSDSKKNNSQDKNKDSTISKANTQTTKQETKQTTSPVEEKQEEKIEEKPEIKEEKTNTPTTSTDEQFNAMYYSITHGNAEHSTLAECNSVGNRIKNNELDEILDWNENNPDNFKQPIIKAHWCYEVMKDGKIYYFLHFITETGANLDSELKNKY